MRNIAKNPKSEMKYVIRILLLAVIVFLGYLTYNTVAKDVKYAEEVVEEEQKVIDKLKVIRDAELAFREVRGEFTGNFDTLINFMKNGQLKVLIAYGDRDDSTTVFEQRIELVSVRDSLFKDVDIDNIRYVPGHGDLEFKLEAGTIEKNNVPVPTFQCTDPEPFSEERRENSNPLRVGNLYDADYSGNWSGNR